MSDKSKGVSWPLILVVIVIVMIMTAGTSFLMVYFFNDSKPVDGADKVIETEKKVDTKMGPQYSLGDFVVNLADARAFQYVKTAVYLEVNEEEQLKELEERRVQLRDAVIMLLRSKTYEEVKGDITPIKTEITEKLNSFLSSGKIKNIYVDEFVFQ